MRHLKIALVSLTVTLSAACYTPWMIEAGPPAPSTPAEGKARVVFLTPSVWGGCNITDAELRFLGQSMAKSSFYADLPAGKHRFFAVGAENTPILDADLSADKTYYVLTFMTPGVMSTRCGMKAIKRDSEEEDKLEEWLSTTGHSVPNGDVGQTWIDKRRKSIEKKIGRAEEKRDDKEAKETSILDPEDGR